MTAPAGVLYLVPNTLDFGIAGTPADLRELLPGSAIRIAAGLGHWICENAKTTRAFLKRVDAVVPLHRPLQEISIRELARPAKGRPPAEVERAAAAADLLEPIRAGADMGLLSEAGLPGLADPGAVVVEAAHRAAIRVVALPGASSIALAVSASGLNGQSFAFIGYLPVEAVARAARIRELEALSRRERQTQVVIETPYRNQALLDALVAHLQPGTSLSVSVGLTTAAELTRSQSVSGWRSRPSRLPADVPAVFSILAR
ncbi:MAG TPA: SAM-dependent methyltransferase [Caldimonas sp.]|jgi:16S rRNA (cytidine1402-2'-O)-methyltransferase|nr:SAM-dependent methyltransferase [Caldimonas sp.]HEX2542287.1 SAM-dependent methyltransferase [Caldimonas sp.]